MNCPMCNEVIPEFVIVELEDEEVFNCAECDGELIYDKQANSVEEYLELNEVFDEDEEDEEELDGDRDTED